MDVLFINVDLREKSLKCYTKIALRMIHRYDALICPKKVNLLPRYPFGIAFRQYLKKAFWRGTSRQYDCEKVLSFQYILDLGNKKPSCVVSQRFCVTFKMKYHIHAAF